MCTALKRSRVERESSEYVRGCGEYGGTPPVPATGYRIYASHDGRINNSYRIEGIRILYKVPCCESAEGGVGVEGVRVASEVCHGRLG